MLRSIVLGAAILGLASLGSAATNLLVDPSFESPLTFDGPPFIGSWEGFSGSPNASAANSTVSPRSGAGHVALAILGDDNSFAGLFQDVLVPGGAPVTFSGWHRTPSTALGVATEMRIEWRNATSEVGRTPNLLTLPGSAYSEFSLTANAPANADRGRFVYAIQTFGGEPNPGNNGTVYLDDFSVVVLPEPTSIALVAPALVGMLRRTRR